MKHIVLGALLILFGFIIPNKLLSQAVKCGLPLLSSKAALLHNGKMARGTGADSLYTIPVVVHVIHTGGVVGSADNPSDSLIKAMINNLNKAWRKNGAVYGGVDMKIQFALATKAPTCAATTGINRVDGSSLPNYTTGGITNYNNPASTPEADVKSLSRWPNTDYINIWIVNKINGDAFSPGGYAYFPELNSATTDGMVLQASVVDGTNKTIVHEMGHVFSLLHTFADGGNETTCATNTDCATQGDLICDTEPVVFATSCTATSNSCTGNPFVVVDVPHNYTVLNNYMGYSDCQWMFTAQQKVRVRNALFAFRHGLISSGGLGAPESLSPAVACTPTASFGLSPFYGVQQVDFNTLNVYSNSSHADGSRYIDRTCNQFTTVIKGQTYPLTITGSYENLHIIKAFIDYNNDGDFNDTGESLFTGNNGIVTTSVIIPLTGVVTNVPLRLRIVADNPNGADPTTCQLAGTSAEGAGQIEDYAVVILPVEIVSLSSGNWNTPATWSCNCVPQNNDRVKINATHVITVTATTSVYDLTLNGGATITIGASNILHLTNTLLNNGTITGAGSLDMNGTNAQAISGAGRIASITINNSLGVTIATGTGNVQTVTGILTVTSGVLTTSSNLVLESTSTNTASIGQGSSAGGYITGEVTVERYIPATGFRAYRTLSSSVNSTGSIKANWQEGASNPDQTTNNNGLTGNGFGTHITGSDADAVNGLDPTQNGFRSLYTYNGATYDPVTSTTASGLDAKTGYLLFVRGDRSNISRLNANSSGNTTLRATGTLLTGSQSYTLNGDNKFTLVTNPYASSIGWDKINPTSAPIAGISNAYTYVDPNIGLQGGYVTVTNAGVRSPDVSQADGTVNIQSGQSFFVKGTTTGAATSLTITEAHKSITNNVNVFRTGSQEQMGIALYFNLDGAQRVADGVKILFNNNYAAEVDANDAEQITNFDEDLSIIRSGKYLSIEGRPLIDQYDTIFLNMTNIGQKEYTFGFNPASFNAPGLLAYLQDNFLNSETPISLTDVTVVPFTVTAIAASSATDRFRVVFRNITILPVNFTLVKAFEKGIAVQVEWNIGNESSLKHYEIEKSTNGRTFSKVGMQSKRSQLSVENYAWLDATPNNGNNYYRIKAIEQNGQYKYSQVVNVRTGKGSSTITIYPNPVKENQATLQFINQQKGRFTITLTNQPGQVVSGTYIIHPGGSASQSLPFQNLATGLYLLKLTDEKGKSTVLKLIK